MWKYILSGFAAIGFVLTLCVIIGAAAFWIWIKAPEKTPPAPKEIVLELDLTQPLTDKNSGFSLNGILDDRPAIPLFAVINAIDSAIDDPRVKGIVARMGTQQLKMAQSEELRAALKEFRDAKKFSYVFAPNYGEYGQGNRALYLASVFGTIWVQPVGTVSLTNLSMQSPFGKSALEKVGLSADFLRRAEYKGAMENFNRDNYSDTVRSNMKSMMDSIAEKQFSAIAEGRGLKTANVAELAAKGPFLANEAIAAKLIDKIGYQDEMLTEAMEKAGPDAKRVDVLSYLAMAPQNSEKSKAAVALITASGIISDQAPSKRNILSQTGVIDTDEIVRAFAKATANPDIKGIIFRVDSPGGSPAASETIRRAMMKAQASKKPVFVSMGEMAASGGYWISMGADQIVADATTVTGSIGVFAGKVVTGGLWDKLGVKWETLSSTGEEPLWSSLRPFDEHGRERVNALLDDTYSNFIKNVSVHRKIPLEKMPEIAKGRVWTGAQAKEIGLVDQIGGMKETILAMKTALNLKPDDLVDIYQYPPPETPASIAIKLLRNMGAESASLSEISQTLQAVREMTMPYMLNLGALNADLVSATMPAPLVTQQF